MEELTGVIGHADHAAALRDHCVGLLAAEGRKSVKPPDLAVPCWYWQGLLRGNTCRFAVAGAQAAARRLRPFAVPGWNRNATRSRDCCGPAQNRPVADKAAIRTRPSACPWRAHVNSARSAFASFRSWVSKPSVKEP
jgi:hypothetical protein